jgi:ribosomal subunit interface protein
MRVQVAGRHLDVGEALRSRIEGDLSAGVAKYFNRATDATVTVGRNGIGYEVDCTLHLASGISLQAQGHSAEPHGAFSDALTKIENRLRRYKRRLKNHHAPAKAPLPAEDASAYVLAPFEDEDEFAPEAANGAENGLDGAAAETAPLVVAEAKIPVRTMTVSMAVLQLDLAEAPALMFRNAAHGRLNMVFRRADGNIGWVDPDQPA